MMSDESLKEILTRAIYTDDRRLWLDPADAYEIADDVVGALRNLFGAADDDD